LSCVTKGKNPARRFDNGNYHGILGGRGTIAISLGSPSLTQRKTTSTVETRWTWTRKGPQTRDPRKFTMPRGRVSTRLESNKLFLDEQKIRPAYYKLRRKRLRGNRGHCEDTENQYELKRAGAGSPLTYVPRDRQAQKRGRYTRGAKARQTDFGLKAG